MKSQVAAFHELNQNLKILTLYSGVATFSTILMAPIWAVFIYKNFHQPAIAVGGLFAFATLVQATFKHALPELGKRFGKKKILTAACLCMAAAPLLYASSEFLSAAILALFLSGLRESMHGHTASALISESAELRVLPKAYGVINSLNGAAMGVAPFIGGLAAWAFGMKAVFYVAAAFSIGSFIIVTGIREKEGDSGRKQIGVKLPHQIYRELRGEDRSVEVFCLVKFWSMMISGSLNALLALYLHLHLGVGFLGLGLFFSLSYLLISSLPPAFASQAADEHGQKTFVSKLFLARGALVALCVVVHDVSLFFILHVAFHYLGNIASPTLSAIQINRVPRAKRAAFVTLISDVGEMGVLAGSVLGGVLWGLVHPGVFLGACALGSILIPATLVFLRTNHQTNRGEANAPGAAKATA